MTSINKGGAEKLHNESYHFKHQQAAINSMYWSGFTHHQREEVQNILKEKSAVFLVHDCDIGDVNSNFMKVSLGNQVLIQQSCNSIPRPLYKELKYYIEDTA